MTTAATVVRYTPVHHWHARHGARFADSGGWQVPVAYVGAGREAAAARSGLAVADVSAFAKVSLLGPGVGAAARTLAGDGPAAKPRGLAALAGMTLACRLTDDHLLLLAATTGMAGLDTLLVDFPPEARLVRNDATTAYAGFCLVGPHVEELLRRLTALDVAPTALPPGSCAETGMAGVQALLVRPAEQGVPTVRVYVGWDVGEYVWERLLAAGRGWDIQPLGLEAFGSLGLAGDGKSA